MSRNGTRRGTPPTGAPTPVPGTTRSGRRRLLSSVLAGMLLVTAPVVTPAAASAAPVSDPVAAAARVAMLAGLSATMTASSYNQNYVASNANDGNASTYWESANNAFPQWIQADLGATVSVDRVVLKLPPASDWQTRTQTLSVLGSTNGSSFTTLKASAGYTFNPASGNTATVSFTAASTRYVRVQVTGNTGWPAAQLSEVEVYGAAGNTDTQAPSVPGNLAYTQPASGQIRLTWSASTDNVGVTGYDVYANGALRGSVNGSTLTYTDSQSASATVSYYVRAKDAAGNQSANSNTVTRTGTGNPPTGTNLAIGKPITASGYVHTFVATNANDNNVATYWEGNGNPSTLTVQLGANASLSQVVREAQPGLRVGRAYPEHHSARPGPGLVELHHPGRRGELHLQPGAAATR